MNCLLIPARLKAKRFPNKMLAPIFDTPLIVHTYNRVKDCQGFDLVRVLIESNCVMTCCDKYGVPHARTEATCKNGTERCADFAMCCLADDDLVVNVQGDEPLMDPSIPQRILFNLKLKPNMVWTAVRKAKPEDFTNQDAVKCDFRNGVIHDFSRTYLPDYDTVHIGIYGYTAKKLKEYLVKRQTPQEIEQNLEQLRWTEQLAAIKVVYDGIGVDRPEHIAMVEDRLS